jgi:diguanylate cyclase (GGDEF)-like protein/PAS domain S-box-containing protein
VLRTSWFLNLCNAVSRHLYEAVILALIVLTGAAVWWQDSLLTRSFVFSPANAASFRSYPFVDREMGGASTAAPDPARGLGWTCTLRPKFGYPYCGYELLFDPVRRARGIDLSKFETVSIRLFYDGPADTLTFELKNYDKRYSKPNDIQTAKLNRLEFPAARGVRSFNFKLGDFTVADWWLAAHHVPPVLGRPQFDNVVAIAVQTGTNAGMGRYRFRIDSIILKRSLMTQQQFYLELMAAWGILLCFLLVVRVAGQKRAWRRELADRERVEAALRQSNDRAYAIVDSIPQIIWEIDRDGHCIYLSPQWYEYTGRPPGEDLEDQWLGAVHPDDRALVRMRLEACIATGEPFEAEYRLLFAGSGYRWTLSRGILRSSPDGGAPRWYGTCTDIHERVAAQEALIESESLNRRIFKASPDSIVLIGFDGGVLDLNEAAALVPQLGGDSWRGRQWREAFHEVDRPRAESAFATARGGKVARFTVRDTALSGKWWDIMLAPLRDAGGKATRVVAIARDITEQKKAEKKAYWIANHDGLTGLPNRDLMQQKLDRAVLEATEGGTHFALLLLDVDDFKRINDTVGHDGGDAMLRTFADRLRDAIQPGDAVFRLGGDEFAILLAGVADAAGIEIFAKFLFGRLREQCLYGGRNLDLRASLGAALFPLHGSSRTELMKNADIALYEAKAAGGRTLKLFHSTMRDEVRKRGSMLSLARAALSEAKVLPFYQPKVNLRSGVVVGFEALLRWRHAQRGMQLPATIAAAFEDPNLAHDISNIMIGAVIEDVRRWQYEGVEFGHVAVNAAAAEFRRPDFAESLLERLHAASVPTRCIQIEVTESVFLGRGAECVERALKMLSAAGVHIDLDDFGTGYASLSHLQKFPVHAIKIDQSFVQGLGAGGGNHAIIDAVVSLGRSLGIEVIAEGIETEAQEQALLRLRCEYGQGFLYSRAVPARLVPSLLQRRVRRSLAA